MTLLSMHGYLFLCSACVDSQVVVDLFGILIEKSGEKIWRLRTKGVTLHSLLRKRSSGGGRDAPEGRQQNFEQKVCGNEKNVVTLQRFSRKARESEDIEIITIDKK